MEQNTKVLEEAYKKIMASVELQKKFVEAVKEKKLEKFLKDQKIEATVEEIKTYLAEKFTSKDGELSKGELDLAAGGEKDEEQKSDAKWFALSFCSFGVGCAISEAVNKNSGGYCTD